MAFRIREITIHVTGGPGPCMPASPDPLCPTPTKPNPVCMGKSNKRPHPQGDPPGDPKKRNLEVLQARLRETLAPPPL